MVPVAWLHRATGARLPKALHSWLYSHTPPREGGTKSAFHSPLTFVGWYQQVQSLLGQISPHRGDLLSQLSIALVLLCPCWVRTRGKGKTCQKQPCRPLIQAKLETMCGGTSGGRQDGVGAKGRHTATCRLAGDLPAQQGGSHYVVELYAIQLCMCVFV